MMYQLITCELPFGSLNNESDLYQYVTRGKSENWNRDVLNNTSQGQKWLPLIDGCLKADFHIRIQTAELALSLVPKTHKSVRVVQNVPAAVPQVETGIALRVMQGEEFGKIYKLNDLIHTAGKRLLTIGRDDDDIHNNIPIKETESSYISRKHCTLEYNPTANTWLLRDGQWDAFTFSKWKVSTNGTYIGSKEVPMNGVTINIGDIISIGDAKLRVEGY